jgi:hypothetical protein
VYVTTVPVVRFTYRGAAVSKYSVLVVGAPLVSYGATVLVTRPKAS